jgi:siroheme synthase (precorrin-2 oxidase/ferrochelatase)
MSLHLDVKYLHLIQHRLPLFKKKGESVWNCRCVLCGDSQTSTHKARGFFYKKAQKISYKCHNCGESQSFSYFLKNLDPILHSQYRLEQFEETHGGSSTVATTTITAPPIPGTTKEDALSVMVPVEDLPETHEVRQYCERRGLPINRLYGINDAAQILPFFAEYRDLKMRGPRLVIPFFTAEKKLIAVSLRGVRGETLRYVTLQHDKTQPLVFGMDQVDMTAPFYVTEGPLDSLFLPNAIACAGTSFGKLDTLGVNKALATVVFDNQPRNREVCKLMEKYIALDYRVCIWPPHVTQKDINDMHVQGVKNITSLIDHNTFSGLEAKIKFIQWRKC